MVLSIEQYRTLEELQRKFSAAYPFLKIEFFRNGQGLQRAYPSQFLLDKRLPVKDARKSKQAGNISIEDGLTVGQLEQIFLDKFGLTVQVFRKSGKVWLETTMTDKWTLKQQNEHGREISTPPPGPRRTE
jgi:hypothetical protein